jgi:hypothetical protein
MNSEANKNVKWKTFEYWTFTIAPFALYRRSPDRRWRQPASQALAAIALRPPSREQKHVVSRL